MEQETMNITYPAKEIENIIRDYFGDALKHVEVRMTGRFAVATIMYTNFKPMRTVRRELEDKIPNIEIGCIDRTYSDAVITNVFNEMYDSFMEIYIEESDGALRKTSFPILIDEMLYHRTFQN